MHFYYFRASNEFRIASSIFYASTMVRIHGPAHPMKRDTNEALLEILH